MKLDALDPKTRATDGAVAPLSSNMMIRCLEGDDDRTLQSWVCFQKMAKEVEELLRAKEGLDVLLKEAREDDGKVLDQCMPGVSVDRMRTDIDAFNTGDAIAGVVEPQ